MFEASEGFVEFFNTVLKVGDVGVVVNWCFNCAFFNGCWREFLLTGCSLMRLTSYFKQRTSFLSGERSTCSGVETGAETRVSTGRSLSCLNSCLRHRKTSSSSETRSSL